MCIRDSLYGEAFGLDLVARGTGGAFSAEDATEIIAGAGEFASRVLAPCLLYTSRCV